VGTGGWRVVGLGDAERGAVLAEEIVGLVVEPALVPELEGGLEAARQARQEVAEAPGVEAEVGRELEEERAQLRAEPRGGATERRRDLAGIAQAQHVGDALRGLQGEAEAGRRLARPAREQRRRGRRGRCGLISTVPKRACVVAEHLAPRQVVGVEAAAPGG